MLLKLQIESSEELRQLALFEIAKGRDHKKEFAWSKTVVPLKKSCREDLSTRQKNLGSYYANRVEYF